MNVARGAVSIKYPCPKKGHDMPNLEKNEFRVQHGTPVLKPDFDAIPRRFSVPCVYILELHGSTYIKVGSTAHIRSRVGAIQTATPYDVRLAFYMAPSYGVGHIFVEKYAHHLLQDHHVKGEWFSCSVKEACSAVIRANDFLADQQ